MSGGVPGINEVRAEEIQDTPLELFDQLGENDLLFIDTSHVVKTGGDVPWIYNQILPRLRSGVVVHLHDVFLPGDYPEHWVREGRAWNELYLIQAFLAFNSAFEIVFGTHWMRQNHWDLLRLAFPGLTDENRDRGSSLWIRRRVAMRLIFTSGSREGQAIDIDGSQLTIGRVADNDVQVADAKVSGRHAVIERDTDGRVVLRDLGSRNGTYVDGERLAGPRVLTGGERLRLGDEQLLVEDPSVAGGSPPREARGFGRRHAALAVAAVVLILIGLAQILLPGVAEDSLRSDLAKYGPVRRVDIHAVPAVKLLARRADPGGGQHGQLPLRAGWAWLAGGLPQPHAQHEKARRSRRHTGDGAPHPARYAPAKGRRRPGGPGAPDPARPEHGFARVRPHPPGERVPERDRGASDGLRPRSERQGERAHPGRRGSRGHAQPDGLPFGSLARVNVFNDKRVYVESVGAQLRGDNYLITARGHLT